MGAQSVLDRTKCFDYCNSMAHLCHHRIQNEVSRFGLKRYSPGKITAPPRLSNSTHQILQCIQQQRQKIYSDILISIQYVFGEDVVTRRLSGTCTI